MNPLLSPSRFTGLPPSQHYPAASSAANRVDALPSSGTISSTSNSLHVTSRKNIEPQLLSKRIAALCRERDICGEAIALLRELLTKVVERDPVHEELDHLVRMLALAPDMFSNQERREILATGRISPNSAGLTAIEDAIQRLNRLASEIVGKPTLVTQLKTLSSYYTDFCKQAKIESNVRSLFRPIAQLATLEGDFYLINPSVARTILSLGEDGHIINTSNSGQLHSVTPLEGIHFKIPGSTPIDFPREVLVSSFYEQLDPGVKASAPTTLVVISNLPTWTLPGVNNVEDCLEKNPTLYTSTELQMDKKGGVAQASFSIGYSTPEDKRAGRSKDAITLEDFLSANDIFSLLDRSFLENPSLWLNEWDIWKAPSPPIDYATCALMLSQWIPNFDLEKFPTIFKTAASPKRWKHLIDTLQVLPDIIRERFLRNHAIAQLVNTPRLFAIGFLARLRRIFSENFPKDRLPREFRDHSAVAS